ncbi:MAG: type II toxin-antitoxin system VapC family toxin [Candidatus Acidiferrum sp.]
MSKTPAFWDSSALVPVCVDVLASPRARTLLRAFLPVVWWGSTVEIYGAICRLHRSKEIRDREKQVAVTRLHTISLSWREMLPDNQVRDLALAILEKYPLRAADALQLGASLTWCQGRPTRRTFITADERLADAARAVGFAVLAFP